MTWPWISPVSGSNLSFVFCGNRNRCETRASRLSSTSSSISAYSSSFESFFLAPFISLLLLTAAECRCGFTRETRAFFQWQSPPCGLFFKLVQLQTCNGRPHHLRLRLCLPWLTALWKSSQSQGLKCWPYSLARLVQLSSAAPRCA